MPSITGYVLITYATGDKTGQYNRSAYFYADRDLAQAEGEKIAAKGDASFLGEVGFEVLALGAAHRGSRCHGKGHGGHPSTQALLRYFEFDHLPDHLAAVSGEFCNLAHTMVALLPEGPETTVCIRKLLEAKDCAVRAALPPRATSEGSAR